MRAFSKYSPNAQFADLGEYNISFDTVITLPGLNTIHLESPNKRVAMSPRQLAAAGGLVSNCRNRYLCQDSINRCNGKNDGESLLFFKILTKASFETVHVCVSRNSQSPDAFGTSRARSMMQSENLTALTLNQRYKSCNNVAFMALKYINLFHLMGERTQ